jgi:large subunit ribosomal protein L35
MPKLKLKTHSGTKDRVKVTKNKRIRVRHTGTNHFQQKKSSSRKRTLEGLETLIGKQAKSIKKRLGV